MTGAGWLLPWRWLRRRHRDDAAAQRRVQAAERAVTAAQERWPEVNDLTDRMAAAAQRALQRPPRPTPGQQRPKP